jgi:hypothetical protein
VTDGDGKATISFTPTSIELRLHLATGRVAASAPHIFVPTSSAGAANGQRLAAPASGNVTATVALSARPVVAAEASAAIVRAGGLIFDRVRVPGLSRAVHGSVEIFGPFSRRAAVSCTGHPYWHGQMLFRGTEARSSAVRVRKAGFYVFRERVLSAGTGNATAGACETALLVAPSIAAGRREQHPASGVSSASGVTPAFIRIPSLGIRARVKSVGIDLRHGTLGIPAAIAVAGWWRDGAAPGSSSGTILIAGHIDSARDGAGAFFALPKARVGQRIHVRTKGKRVYTYRIVSVRSYPKRALPLDVYSSQGAGRLVLVTCGGPFDAATGHYVDNVVVTATPA